MRRDRRILRVLSFAAALVAALATDAFARAGGGGNFGGGGGGGGGGGDGGGGLFWLIWLCFQYPPIGIVVLLIVLYVAYHAKHGYVASQSNLLRGGATAARMNLASDLVERFRAHDPTFDAAAFDARVQAAFRKAQDAWCRQDLTPIRPFVSDGVHERFSMQIDEERSLGYRDHLESLTIDSSRIADVNFEGAFESVVVRIAATAADYRVSLATGARESGDTAPEPFVEFWTFLRRRGTKSLAGRAGLMEGQCPNCGFAVEGNQFAECPSCHAKLRSGEFDWVLVEITQGSEWMKHEARDVPGVAALEASDPEFCVEALEDRASVAFWRWATATRSGDAKPLVGLASDDVVRAVASAWSDPKAPRRFVGECGVGGVDLLGVSRDGDVDRALVEVRWSGTEFETRPGSRDLTPRRLDRTGVKSFLFAFERAASAKSRIGDSFSSAHCRGCGAPAEGTSTTCAYCGAALVDVNAGWTLARMATRYEAAGRMLLDGLRDATAAASPEPPAAPPPAPVPAGVIAWAARVVAADGVVDAGERAALAGLASRARISDERLEEILRDAMVPGADPPLPTTAEEARDWLEFAARAALADGVVTSEESALLMRLGAEARMSPADVRVLVNRVKAQMFQEARAEIARARGRQSG